MTQFAKLRTRLIEPISNNWLVYFRIAFGLMMCLEIWWFFSKGLVTRFYVQPTIRFSYDGFSWVPAFANPNLYYAVFGLLALTAIFITLGFCYRLSAALFALSYNFLFLQDQVNYQNHEYLICLVSIMMVFLPAHRKASIDAWRKPELRSDWCPTWMLWLVRFQLGIVYFYGGLAKLKPEWLQGDPMRMWLEPFHQHPFFGSYVRHEFAPYFFSWGGLLLDLFIVPLLLWKRTRIPAALVAVGFHLANSQLFPIRIFPWFMIATTPLFFSLSFFEFENAKLSPRPTPQPVRRSLRFLVTGYVVIHLLLPFRHYLYPGKVIWTEEGQLFAWHMRIRDKDPVRVRFRALDGQGQTIPPREVIAFHNRLTPKQRKFMQIYPYLVHKFCHKLAAHLEAEGHPGNVQIYADVEISLNGKPARQMTDPRVDLAAEEYRIFQPAPWILQWDDPRRDQPQVANAW